MAAILKKQIIKHLSKFAKNVTSDKINISTLKGEGELHNLELNEDVLMDLMDLPTWLVVTKAKCNKLGVKIPWTKIKTTPAALHLDRVEVEMKVTDEFRSSTEDTPLHSSGGKYSLSDRLIDGLYVSVNEILIDFKSDAFHASVLMSQFSIRSTTPDWEFTNDLHETRIKDKNNEELLIFKEAECQTLRVNIDAVQNETTTPILIITHEGKIRFAIKKRLQDCMVLTSKIHLVLTDILLVFTDTQLKAAIEFVQMIVELNEKSQDLVKADMNILSQSKHMEEKAKSKTPGSEQSVQNDRFDMYDITESSYHIAVEIINMHLVDEQNKPKVETFKRRTESGAMKLNMKNVAVDMYPYHVYNTIRSHWQNYNLLSDAIEKRDTWVKHLLANFRQQVKVAKDQGRPYLQEIINSRQAKADCLMTSANFQSRSQPQVRSHHVQYAAGKRIDLSSQHTRSDNRIQQLNHHQQYRGQQHPRAPQHVSVPPRPKRQPKLMESCVVVRLDDFSISAVTTEESANSNKKFLSSDNEAFSLPPEMSSLHVEYTSYYFLDGLEYPVPQPNIYVKLNPIKLEMDYMTVLWINLFANHMASGVQMKPDGGESDILSELYHNDIRIDALMPRITIPAEKMVPDQPDRPNALQIQFSQVILSNCRIATEASRSDLASAIQNLYGGTLFTDQQQYPNEKSDLTAVSQMLWNHAYKTGESEGTKHCTSSPVAVQGKGNIASVGTNEKIKNQPISKMSFFTQASEDVWCAHLDQVWMDFLGVESAKGRPVPLVEAVPISIWACLPKESQSYKAKLLPKNKIPEVSSVKDDSIVKLNGEISHQNKRLLYGHRKAESVSYPIFGTTSPASTPTSDNISMSMSDLTMKDTSIKGALSDSSLQSSNTSGIGTMDSGGSTISSLRTMLGSSESMSSTATTDSAFSSVSTSNSRIQANQQSFTSGESVDTCDNDVADTNLLVEVKGKIRVMINHPQIMFLLRLIDSFQALTDSIEEDIVMFHGKSETVSSVVVAARLHSAEVLLNLPPIAESKGDKNNGMNAEVKCPGIDACGADVTTDADCVNRQSDIQDSVMNSDISSRINVNEEQAMNANTKAVDVTDYTKIKPAVLIVDSSIDPLENGDVASDYELLSLDIQHGVRFGVKKDEVVNTEGERTLQQEVLRNTHNSDVQSYGAMNAVAEFDDTDDFGEFQQADINRRNDFKEQELLKTAPECALPMNSLANLVNKDEIVVSGEMNTMEDNLKCTSSTKDCCDNTESSEVTKTEKEDLAKLVSIIKVKLSDLQLGVQLFGDNSGLKTVLGDVELQENGNKNYTEFVDQWVADNNRMKDEQLPPLAKSENPAISLRLSLGSCAEKYCPGTSIKKHVGLKVNGLNTQLLMSTLTSLVDLVEDEKKGDNDDEMPIDIEITQACIKLKTPSSNNIASQSQVLDREESSDAERQGSVLSEAPSEGAPSSIASSPTDNNSQVTSPTSEINPLLEEVHQLKEQLGMTRSALSTVEQERASLLHSLMKLQDELIDTERERENMRQEVVRLRTMKRSVSSLSLR